MVILRTIRYGWAWKYLGRTLGGMTLLIFLYVTILREDGLVGPEHLHPGSNSKLRPSRKHAKGHKFLIGKTYQDDSLVHIDGNWTQEKAKAQEAIFQKRFSALSTTCEKLGNSKPPLRPNISKVYENIRWVTEHDLIWCPVYKAASTTWMINLLRLAGETEIRSGVHKSVRRIYGPPNDTSVIRDALKTSMKMLIVRHPLERLLSAYRDKFLREVSHVDLFAKLSAKIMRLYPEGGFKGGDDTLQEDRRQQNATHPTFTQFLMRVRRDMRRFWKKGGQAPVNNHWQPVWWACAPCTIKYDTIAHVETLTLDQEYIIHKTGLENVIYNTHTHASNFDIYNGTSDASRHYFAQVPRTLLKAIVDLYRPDFELFGYEYKQYIKLGKIGVVQ